MLDRHSSPSGMLRPNTQPGRTEPMRIARVSIGTVSLFVAFFAVVLALGMHLRGASLSQGTAAEDPMIPKIEAIFAPLSDPASPGVAALVRRSGRTVFERGYGVRELNSRAAI